MPKTRAVTSVKSAAVGALLGLLLLVGCSAEETDRESSGPAVATFSAPEPVSTNLQPNTSAIEPGEFRVVAHEDGTVSILAHSAPRLPVLTELAIATDFLLEVHTPPWGLLTSELDRVTLRSAIPEVVGDVEYQAEWLFDAANNQHRLISITVGYSPVIEATEIAAPIESDRSTDFEDMAAQMREEMIAEVLPEIITGRPAIGLSEDELRQRLRDPDPRVRMEAAIEITPEEEGLKDLVDLLHNDPDPGVRAAATVSLENSEEVAGVHALLDALDDPNPLVRIEVIDSLEFAGDPSVLPKISPLLQDPDPRVQAAAAEAVRFLSDDEIQ